MRDIKFRQKLKPHFVRGSGEFHYWGYIDGDFTSPVGKNYCDTPDEQYAGLKDVNGVEIYEGDVVMCNNQHKGVIEWEENDYCFNVSDYYCSSNDYPTMAFMEGQPFVVIGNIHQNPELLEQYNG